MDAMATREAVAHLKVIKINEKTIYNVEIDSFT
jgi:hypothetical protein